MISPLVIRPDAEHDLAAAASWYDGERAGLGSEFLVAVRQVLTSIRDRPLMYPMVLHRIRRALLRRFPYGLFYVVEDDRIVVLACFHVMRDPKLIRSILKGRR